MAHTSAAQSAFEAIMRNATRIAQASEISSVKAYTAAVVKLQTRMELLRAQEPALTDAEWDTWYSRNTPVLCAIALPAIRDLIQEDLPYLKVTSEFAKRIRLEVIQGNARSKVRKQKATQAFWAAANAYDAIELAFLIEKGHNLIQRLHAEKKNTAHLLPRAEKNLREALDTKRKMYERIRSAKWAITDAQQAETIWENSHQREAAPSAFAIALAKASEQHLDKHPASRKALKMQKLAQQAPLVTA